MSDLRQNLKNVIPEPLWRAARNAYIGLQHAALWPEATFHPWRRESVQRLEEYHNKHRGRRCFLIGNGPSLKQTDMSRLKGEFTFGTNRIYLMFPELGFPTTYYLSINSLVIE